MTSGLRKFVLTAHIAASVGWFGAVAGFLALALAGLASPDAQLVRAAYPTMAVIGRSVIVPLSFASLVTGVVQSLSSTWGLFRHYWVVAKLLINILATAVLLEHMQPVNHLSRVAAETPLTLAGLSRLRVQVVADAGLALLVLLMATTLAVYKPRGLTPYGWRKQHQRRARSPNGVTEGA